uniref:F-box domain-containing protein n=1 Tax=Nelumbo nucifera TaxID=4432 RepID=A0A822XMX3_NELNU|nr:TPA_asm: hypothetical protein HUJ06_021769 [Nelumbo nucifera]
MTTTIKLGDDGNCDDDNGAPSNRGEDIIQKQNLPDELITEILSRLPVKPLLRFNCVCKPWRALISDPGFIKKHAIRSIENEQNINLILRGCYLYSVEFDACDKAVELDHPLKSPNYVNVPQVVGSCNGAKIHPHYNPSARQHQKLPYTPIESREKGYIVYGFGYDPIADDYKVVRIVEFYGDDDDSFDSEVKVYTQSSNSWRRVGDVPFSLRYKISGMLANSALHWIWTVLDSDSKASNLVFSFDLRDEEYRVVPLPSFPDDSFRMNVRVLRGRLCILCNYYKFRVDIWVMNEYGVKESWSRQFSIAQPSVIRSFEYLRPLCFSKNGELLLEQDNNRLVLYDSKSERARVLRIHGIPDWFETEIFVGSLIPLSGRDGALKQKKAKRKGKKKKRISISNVATERF